LNDAPVAGIVVSIGNPWASAIIAGYDPHYGKCCPGLIAVEQCVKWAFDNGFDLDFGVGSERFKSYWARGEASTAWTVQIINSVWGLLAIRGRRLARELAARVRPGHVPEATAPDAANHDSPLTPAMTLSGQPAFGQRAKQE
jgi:CelD/BcsL family acetyltransferase involved in cellulose biosynthesis